MDAITAFITAHLVAISTVGPILFEILDRALPTKKPSGIIHRIADLLKAVANGLDAATGNNVKTP